MPGKPTREKLDNLCTIIVQCFISWTTMQPQYVLWRCLVQGRHCQLLYYRWQPLQSTGEGLDCLPAVLVQNVS